MFDENKEVAETILYQLGGSRFVAMTGAKDFLAVDKGVMFCIPRARNIRKVAITVTHFGTYNMEFIAVRGLEIKVIEQRNGVHYSQLQAQFTRVTGLDIHL